MITICNDQTYPDISVPHIAIFRPNTSKGLSFSQVIGELQLLPAPTLMALDDDLSAARSCFSIMGSNILLLGSTIVVFEPSIYFHARSVFRKNF